MSSYLPREPFIGKTRIYMIASIMKHIRNARHIKEQEKRFFGNPLFFLTLC